MGDHVGFGAICGTNSGRTGRSHNFFSSYPNWMKKEARWPFFSILNSLRQVSEAFSHCKYTFVVILSIMERPKHWKLDQGDVEWEG